MKNLLLSHTLFPKTVKTPKTLTFDSFGGFGDRIKRKKSKKQIFPYPAAKTLKTPKTLPFRIEQNRVQKRKNVMKFGMKFDEDCSIPCARCEVCDTEIANAKMSGRVAQSASFNGLPAGG